MNKKIFWTTVALLTTALSVPLSSYAESKKADQPSGQNSEIITAQIPPAKLTNVLKVGEYQAVAATHNSEEAVIARIQPHEQSGNQAATLYVRNIPVITFSSNHPVTTSSIKVSSGNSLAQVANVGNLPDSSKQADPGNHLNATNAPVWQATAVAAKLNQLNLDKVDASKITVSWQAGGDAAKQKQKESYLIKVNNQELVEINTDNRLPDRTENLAVEALQATNRLRRLLGNAPPLQEISGKPQPAAKQPQQIASSEQVRLRLNGTASWYGPGFHGNRTANGETYNQNALTAAHRSLPFGTKVRVTNKGTGRSVVVRINDRGPYIGGRIIDLSAAAARMVGVMQSGIAPVRVEVLD